MGTINLVNSLRYDMTGRRRKTSALTKKKRPKSIIQYHTRPTVEQPKRETKKEEFARILAPLKSDFERAKEIQEQIQFEKDKKEISSRYTVAPAYNKGAYQVIPKECIKDIGK